MGARAIKERLESFDLEGEALSLREIIRTGKGRRRLAGASRLKVVSAFLTTRNDARGMVLDAVPVIPPDLRPMVQLDGGRFATRWPNDLYRRVIDRKDNHLKRLLDLCAPEIIVNNEKRMLQESVDALFDNGRRGRPVTRAGQPSAEVDLGTCQGQAGPVPAETCSVSGSTTPAGGSSSSVRMLKLHQCGLPKGHGDRAVQAVRHEAAWST